VPVRGAGEDETGRRWSFGSRAILGIPVDRARLRLTLTYAFHPRLSAGVEWNPLGEDIGPLANLRLLDETPARPALLVGTSSDRIGTPRGRAYYGTVSKNVEPWTGLPLSPYVGAAYGEYEDERRLIGGLRVRYDDDWSSAHLWDGVNLHHIVDRVVGERYRLRVLLVEQAGEYYGGVRFGVGF